MDVRRLHNTPVYEKSVMEDRPKGNTDLKQEDLFKALNPYFLLLFSASCLLGSLFVQELFVMAGYLRAGLVVAPAVGIVLPLAMLARRFSGRITRQLRIFRPALPATAQVAVATLAMVVIVDNLYTLTQHFMPPPELYLESLKSLRPHGTLSAVLTFLGLCVVVPLAEELIFRGVVQRVFMANMGGAVGAVLAGVFFGALHLNAQLLLGMAAFGVFVGLVFYYSANLTYAILSHGLFNSVAFLQLALTRGESVDTSPFYVQHPWATVVAVVVVFAALRNMRKGASTNVETPSITPGPSDEDPTT